MRVSADLYRHQPGRYPARCVLAFVETTGCGTRRGRTSGRYPRLIYTVHPHPHRIAFALAHVDATVEAIEAERTKPSADQADAPDHPVDRATGEACELRFYCACFPDGVRQRAEALSPSHRGRGPSAFAAVQRLCCRRPPRSVRARLFNRSGLC